MRIHPKLAAKIYVSAALASTATVRAFSLRTPARLRAVRPLSILSEAPRTLYDKIWDDHLVDDDGQSSLIYVDRHLVHEVTSPQAFDGLRLAHRSVRRPDCTLVTVDHNVPTSDRSKIIDVETFIEETASRTQVLQLEKNIADFGLKYFSFTDERQVFISHPPLWCVYDGSHAGSIFLIRVKCLGYCSYYWS
jgi:Aconitase family (aconitate hydratase)